MDKLKKVLQDNKKWPLIIVGVAAQGSNDATIIPATVPERDLHAGALVIKQYLVIDGLDGIDGREQEKFITLLKDRRIGLRKLAPETRIIIPVRSADNVSQKIKSLCLVWEFRP
jgi:hypothetical protein